MSGQTDSLEMVEIRPIGAVPNGSLDKALKSWIGGSQRRRSCLMAGQVITVENQGQTAEFAVAACSPSRGGLITEQTAVSYGSTAVPILKRVHLTCLDSHPSAMDVKEDQLFDRFIRPFFDEIRKLQCREGRRGRFVVAFSKDQIVNMGNCDFAVEGLDPSEKCGAVDAGTRVFCSHVEMPALHGVHVLPYADSLPTTRAYDLFSDYLQPFFQQKPFAVYKEGDHFSYGGVRFRVIATSPPHVAARVGIQTLVQYEGAPLQPRLASLLNPEAAARLRMLPPGLQMLLSNALAQDVQRQVHEANQVLSRGEGLSPSEIEKVGRVFRWTAAERAHSSQDQCMVCLNNFAEGEEIRELPCEHIFHKEHIDEWLHRSANCPICKQPVLPQPPQRGPHTEAGTATAAAVAGGGSGLALLQGARVAFHGNRHGTVSGFDEAARRFRVAPDGDVIERLLPADGLVQLLRDVRLFGLHSRHYNGERVQIVSFDASTGRYLVTPTGRSAANPMSVSVENCIYPEHSVVRIVGLRASNAAARWNGHYCHVVGFDLQRMRHIVSLPMTRQLLSIKPANLRA